MDDYTENKQPSILDGDTAERARQSAQDVASEAKIQGQELASEVSTQARETVKQVRKQFFSAFTDAQNQVVDQVGGIASAFGKTGQSLRDENQGDLADVVERISEQVTHVTDYLRDRDLNTLVRDTERLARNKPEIFVGGAVLLGVLAGRFLKSSSHNTYGARNQGSANYSYGGSYQGGAQTQLGYTGPSSYNTGHTTDTRITTTPVKPASAATPSSDTERE